MTIMTRPIHLHPFFNPKNYKKVQNITTDRMTSTQIPSLKILIQNTKSTIYSFLTQEYTSHNNTSFKNTIETFLKKLEDSSLIRPQYEKYYARLLNKLVILLQSDDIDKSIRFQEIETLLSQTQTCPAGVMVVVSQTIESLETCQNNIAQKIYSQLRTTISAYTDLYLKQYLPNEFKYEIGNHIHYNNTFTNIASQLLNREYILDKYDAWHMAKHRIIHFKKFIFEKINPLWFLHELFTNLFEEIREDIEIFNLNTQDIIIEKEWFSIYELDSESYSSLNKIIKKLEQNLSILGIQCDIPFTDIDNTLPFLKRKKDIEEDIVYFSLKQMPFYLLSYIIKTIYHSEEHQTLKKNKNIVITNDLIYQIKRNDIFITIDLNILSKHMSKIDLLPLKHIKNIMIQCLYLEPELNELYCTICSMIEHFNFVFYKDKYLQNTEINIIITETAKYIAQQSKYITEDRAKQSFLFIATTKLDKTILNALFLSSTRENIFLKINDTEFKALLQQYRLFIYDNIESLTLKQLKIIAPLAIIPNTEHKKTLIKKIFLSENASLLLSFKHNKTLQKYFFSTNIDQLYDLFFQLKEDDPNILPYIEKLSLKSLMNIIHKKKIPIHSSLTNVIELIRDHIQKNNKKIDMILCQYTYDSYHTLLRNLDLFNLFIQHIQTIPKNYIPIFIKRLSTYIDIPEYRFQIDYKTLLSKLNFINVILLDEQNTKILYPLIINSNIEQFKTIIDTPFFLFKKTHETEFYAMLYNTIVMEEETQDKTKKLNYCLYEKKLPCTLKTLQNITMKINDFPHEEKIKIFQNIPFLQTICYFNQEKSNITAFQTSLSLELFDIMINKIIDELQSSNDLNIINMSFMQLFLGHLLFMEDFFSSEQQLKTFLIASEKYLKHTAIHAIQQYRYDLISYDTLTITLIKNEKWKKKPFDKNRNTLINQLRTSSTETQKIIQAQPHYVFDILFDNIPISDKYFQYHEVIPQILLNIKNNIIFEKLLLQYIRLYLQYHPTKKKALLYFLLKSIIEHGKYDRIEITSISYQNRLSYLINNIDELAENDKQSYQIADILLPFYSYASEQNKKRILTLIPYWPKILRVFNQNQSRETLFDREKNKLSRQEIFNQYLIKIISYKIKSDNNKLTEIQQQRIKTNVMLMKMRSYFVNHSLYNEVLRLYDDK